MRKFLLLLLGFCTCITGCSSKNQSNNVGGNASKTGMPKKTATFTNPILSSGADPWIIQGENGKYYYCFSANGGICVQETDDFTELADKETYTVWTPPSGTAYSQQLWAPELHYIDGEWYIYVACDDGDNANHRMYVLKGTTQSPTDPFTFMGKISDSTDKWAIDGTVMKHNDKLYFVWSGWDGDVNVDQRIYIAEMSDACTISSERVCISIPEYDWERIGTPRVNEGPVAISHNGKTHIIYSASGSWTDDYCLGILTLEGEDPLDSVNWEKGNLPIFQKTDNLFGPGHCSFTTAPDGSTWIIYHVNEVSGSGWEGRRVSAQPITWSEDNYPVLGTPIEFGKEIEKTW